MLFWIFVFNVCFSGTSTFLTCFVQQEFLQMPQGTFSQSIACAFAWQRFCSLPLVVHERSTMIYVVGNISCNGSPFSGGCLASLASSRYYNRPLISVSSSSTSFILQLSSSTSQLGPGIGFRHHGCILPVAPRSSDFSSFRRS